MSIVLAYLPQMLCATVLAVQIAALGIIVSWIVGLAAAAAKDSPWRIARVPAELFIWFTRGAPPLIQVLLIYFGIRQLGVGLSPFAAGVVALGASSGGFVAEIFRSGLKSIPKGQWESSLAIGMGTVRAFRRVILPQVVRVVVPALGGEAINTLKNTSLLSAITVAELTLLTQGLVASTFRPFAFYMTAALIYLALTTVISLGTAWYERRYRLHI